jgi:monovalent cation:H+ antiporter-2, CPA2 family
MNETLIFDLLIILSAGLFAALICRRLGVSGLIGYLLVGAALGGGGLGWVDDEGHELESFAEAGVFLLLFSIGLEFSLDDLRRMGRELLIGGSVQMVLVAVPVGGALYAAGLSPQAACLLASATAFSSTVLVFKALSEWGQASSPHGRRAIGILLFQDAALVPLLLLVPFLTGGGQTAGPAAYAWLAVTSVLFVVGVLGIRYALDRWIIPSLAGYRSPELIILFTLVALGGITMIAYKIGLPPAVGAFAAGLSFSGNRWTKQIDALVLPFRETFAAVFFVGLGLISQPRLFWVEPVLIAECLVGLILVKTMAATIALRLTRLPWRSAMGMGVGLAHVGEFAFVLVLLGLESGVVSELNYQRLVAVAVGSLVLTPLILKAGLRWTRDADGGHASEPKRAVIATEKETDASVDRTAVVIGAGPIGRRVASQLETLGKDICLVDLSPINLHSFAQEGFRTVAGDATDPAILTLAGADRSPVVAVCVPNDEIAIRVVLTVRQINPAGFIAVRCRYQSNAAKLQKAGAAAVVSEEVEACGALLRVLSRIDNDA